MKPTNQLVKLWSAVIDHHQSEASRQKQVVEGSVNRWRQNVRRDTAEAQLDQIAQSGAANADKGASSAVMCGGKEGIRNPIEIQPINTVLRKPITELSPGRFSSNTTLAAIGPVDAISIYSQALHSLYKL